MYTKYFEDSKKITNACPRALMYVTTNGSSLTASNIEKLLNLHYMRQITISVDAGTKETYESIRKGGKWEVLIRNISRLIEEKKKRKLNRSVISTNFVVMKSNFRELPLYVKKMANLGVDIIGTVNAHNTHSSDFNQGIFDLPWKVNDVAEERERVVKEVLNIDLPQKTKLLLTSFTPTKQSIECSERGASCMVVGIEGDIFPCCIIQSLTYEGRAEAKPMGNIFEEGLESIWNSKQYVDFRVKMLKGQAPNSICLNCPFYYGM